MDGILAVRAWLESTHGCTFRRLIGIEIACAPDYDTIKATLLAHGIDLSVPTYAHAPGPVGPGSYGDPEQLAVKETASPAVIAHELGHLWTGLGNEAHDDVDSANPFGVSSIMGPVDDATWPNYRFIPAHLELALQRGYIKRL